MSTLLPDLDMVITPAILIDLERKIYQMMQGFYIHVHELLSDSRWYIIISISRKRDDIVSNVILKKMKN